MLLAEVEVAQRYVVSGGIVAPKSRVAAVAQRYVVSGGGRRSKVCCQRRWTSLKGMFVSGGGGRSKVKWHRGRSKVTSCSGRSNVQFAEVTHRS